MNTHQQLPTRPEARRVHHAGHVVLAAALLTLMCTDPAAASAAAAAAAVCCAPLPLCVLVCTGCRCMQACMSMKWHYLQTWYHRNLRRPLHWCPASG